MIPNTSISSFYARIAGDRVLLGLAQSNLMANLDRITKVRTHTYLVNNGQNESGISHNFGNERCYTWNDTVIDCASAPALCTDDALQHLDEAIATCTKFKIFKREVEERSAGQICVSPFFSIGRKSDVIRYDAQRFGIKCADSEVIRVGVKLTALDEATFKQGLESLRRAEDPIHMSKPLMRHRKIVMETA